MNIDGVKNGIVLDHIKAGKSMQVYELLGLIKGTTGLQVSRMQQAPSMERKISSRSMKALNWTWTFWDTLTVILL